MGACISASEHDQTIKKSILNSFIPDHEWDEFLHLFTIETHRSTGKHIRMKSTDAMYVVLSGQVKVIFQKTPPPQQLNTHSSRRNSVATSGPSVETFTTGEVIHMFSNPFRTNDDGFITHKDLQLVFMPCMADGKPTTIATLSVENVNKFINSSRSNPQTIEAFTWFANLKIGDLLANKNMTKGLSTSQLDIFGPLLKLTVAREGSAVQYEMLPPIPQNFLQRDPSTKSAVSDNQMRSVRQQHRPLKQAHVILGGQCLALREDLTFDDYKIRLASRSAGDNIYSDPFTRSAKNNEAAKPAVSIVGALLNKFVLNKANNNKVHIATDPSDPLGEVLDPGNMFGLETCFLTPDRCFQNIVACSDCLLGMFSNAVFESIKAIERPFFKTIYTNFNLYLLSFVDDIQLISELSEADRLSLCRHINHRVVNIGEVVFHQGDPAENIYIVLNGAVQETVNESNDSNNQNPQKKDAKLHGSFKDREAVVNALGIKDMIFDRGQVFGEVALVTESCYSSTITAREHTLLFAINKKTFRAIFNQDKSKLAEMKIRLLGENVELEYLLSHPKGYGLFVDYLEKEHSAENIQFYLAVDRFDDMYKRIWKQYIQMEQDSHVKSDDNGSAKNSPSNQATQSKKEVSMRCVSSRRCAKKPNENMMGNQWKALDSNIKELNDVCRNIIEKFIVDGSLHQVNIPGKMRVEAEKLYAEWLTSQSRTSSVKTSQSGSDTSAEDTAEAAKTNDPTTTLSFDANSFIKVRDIFKRPKKEVYELLKKDTYVRLKLTDDFSNLIDTIRLQSTEGNARESIRTVAIHG